MRLISILASLVLHATIVLLGVTQVFFPSSKRIDLDKQIYEVNLVQAPAPSKPAKKMPEPKAESPSAPEPKKTPAPQPKKTKSAPAPAKKEPAAAKKISAKKAPQPKKTAPKKAEKAQPKPKPKAAQSQPTPDSVLKDALSDVAQQAEDESGEETMQALRSEVESLRASLQQQAGDAAAREGARAGAVEVYAALVEQRVKAQWRYAALGSSRQLRARVVVTISAQGTITGVQLQDASGNEGFDRSVLRAVEDTESLPPPPGKKLRQISITFNLQAKG